MVRFQQHIVLLTIGQTTTIGVLMSYQLLLSLQKQLLLVLLPLLLYVLILLNILIFQFFCSAIRKFQCYKSIRRQYYECFYILGVLFIYNNGYCKLIRIIVIKHIINLWEENKNYQFNKIQIIKQLIKNPNYSQEQEVDKMCSNCRNCCQGRPRIRNTPTFYHHPIFEDGTCCTDRKRSYRNSPTFYSNVFNHAPCPGRPSKKHSNCQCKQIISRQHQPQNETKEFINSNPNNNQNNKANQIRQRQQNTKNYDEIQTQPLIRPASAGKQPKLYKQVSFNPNGSTKFQNAGGHNALSNHTLLWYNPEKQLMLRQTSNCFSHGLPRQRKLLELSSCPFYTEIVGPVRQPKCCNNKQLNQNINEPTYHSSVLKPNSKLNSCNQCADYCPCDKQCICNDNCVCCARKQYMNQTRKDKKCQCKGNCTCSPNCKCCINQQKPACSCSNGNCKCDFNCSCGLQCKCCLKFLSYQKQNIQRQKRNPRIVCPKQSYKNITQNKFCKCGPQCGCGPECRCGDQCRCDKFKSTVNEYDYNKVELNTKKNSNNVVIQNGTKKTKNLQNNIRKSVPVFKSVTGRRG